MPLESATYINDLNSGNPVGASDPRSQGDDHLRLIKAVLKNSFPNMTAPGFFDILAAQSANIVSSANTTATPAPFLILKSTGTGTDATYLGALSYRGKNDLGVEKEHVRLLARMGDATSATEDGEFYIQTIVNGVLATRIAITSTSATIDGIPLAGLASGTRTVFQQTAAPVGWTKDVTHTNKALRLTNGAVTTGGTVAFSTAFTNQAVTVSATALTEAQMPFHAHSVNITSGAVSADHAHFFSANTGFVSADHSHAFNVNSGTVSSFHQHGIGSETTISPANNTITGGTSHQGSGTNIDSTFFTGTDTANHVHNVAGSTGGISANHYHGVSGWSGGISVNHTHFVSGGTSGAGSSTGHTHTGTAINMDVQFVDFILATKD